MPTTPSTLLWNGGGSIFNGFFEFADRLTEDSHRGALLVFSVDLAFTNGKVFVSVLSFLEVNKIGRPAGADHSGIERSGVCHDVLREVGGLWWAILGHSA